MLNKKIIGVIAVAVVAGVGVVIAGGNREEVVAAATKAVSEATESTEAAVAETGSSAASAVTETAEVVADAGDAVADAGSSVADAGSSVVEGVVEAGTSAVETVTEAGSDAVTAIADAGTKASTGARAGTFTGASDHVTKGGAVVMKGAEGWEIHLGEDFWFDGAPDPRVGFGKDGVFVEATDFEPLRENTGAQVYKVPANLNPEEFDDIVVWCRQFSVPLGVASLK